MKRILVAFMISVILATAAVAADSGKKMLSKQEMKALVQKASTPADHSRLAEQYRSESERLGSEAKDHAEMAKMYRAHPTISEMKRPGAGDTASHCESLSEYLAKASNEASALSAAHARMAKQ
jgi:hypothetical protein